MQQSRMFQMMKYLGIIDDDDDEIGNTNMTKDSNSNNKINFNEFSSFLQNIYLNCKNNGIEPKVVFSWITDLHQITSRSPALPNFSDTINYSSNNNMEKSLLY
jgi:hypothetical protein